MARDTSIETYKEIKENGLLSHRRFQVYEIIAKYGPINCRQIIQIASRGTVTNTGAFSGRLSELERQGVIAEDKQGPCPITGNNTIFWKSTGKLPIKLTKKEKIKCSHCNGKGFLNV